MYLCVRGIECLYQASQWSCFYVLGVMYLCVRGIECLYQASEWSCICVLGVSSACTRLVSGHVSVC